MSNSTVTRKERESQRHRLEILEAAEAVFSEKGYVSASMEEVARRAEFSVGTLYNFFKNKEDLYAELLRHKASLLQPPIEAALASGANAYEKVVNCLRTRFILFWEHRAFFRLFFQQTMGTVCDSRAGFTPDILRQYEDFCRRMEQIVEEGIAAGLFRPVSASMLTLAMEGVIHAHVARISRVDAMERNPQEEEDLLEIILKGILADPNARSTQHDRRSKGTHQ